MRLKKNDKSGVTPIALSLLISFVLTLACAIPGMAGIHPSDEEWKAWQKVQAAGSEAFDKCEYGKAERLLKKAMEMAREIGPGDIRIAKSPGDLGRLLEVRGRFTEAQPLLEEEFYLKDRAVGNENGQIVLDMENLIRFYITEGTAERAAPLGEDLLAFVQGKFREQARQTKGKITLDQGQPLNAWAGTAGPRMHDPMLEWSISCDRVGDYFRYHGNLDMADRFYKTALDLKATVLGKRHLSLANSYDYLGMVCMLRGEEKDLKDAESYFRDALSISEEVMEPGDKDLYPRIDKLARCLIKEKKFSEAEQLYWRAVKVCGGDWTEPGQRALFRLGCMYTEARRFGAAAPVLRRALRHAEHTYGSCSVQLMPYLRQLAYVSYYAGARGEHESLKARANNISPFVKELKANVSTGHLKVD